MPSGSLRSKLRSLPPPIRGGCPMADRRRAGHHRSNVIAPTRAATKDTEMPDRKLKRTMGMLAVEAPATSVTARGARMSTISQREGAAAATAVALDVRLRGRRLRRVVLHRPDLELRAAHAGQQGRAALRRRAVGPPARQEHDAFADALRERGDRGPATSSELLAETLEIDGVREPGHRRRPLASSTSVRGCGAGAAQLARRSWRRASWRERPDRRRRPRRAALRAQRPWPPPSRRRRLRARRRCRTTCSRATRRAGSTAA